MHCSLLTVYAKVHETQHQAAWEAVLSDLNVTPYEAGKHPLTQYYAFVFCLMRQVYQRGADINVVFFYMSRNRGETQLWGSALPTSTEVTQFMCRNDAAPNSTNIFSPWEHLCPSVKL